LRTKRLSLAKGRSPSLSEMMNTMVETLADPEGMREDKPKHPNSIPLLRG
jgi:hypothetical protein